MVSWYATEYWSAGEFVSSFFKWAKTDSWTVSNETPNFDATYIWKCLSISTILYDDFKGGESDWNETYFVTCFLIHYFFIWFFSRIWKQIFWQVNLKNNYHVVYITNSYLEPRMFYDVTDSGSFHGIDLEHLSDQVCYWRIFYMFWRFVNSSFNLKKFIVFHKTLGSFNFNIFYLLKKFICIIIIKRECSTK